MKRIHNFSQLINVGLRGLTLGSKFLLVFFLARFLEPAELGVYGLIVATISYSLYLLGFDFYTYTTRELLRSNPCQWGGFLKAQGALTLLLYSVFLPLLSLVFLKELLPLRVIWWFFALVVLEHLSQELGRLLVALSEQLYASLILFLRAGVWGIAVILVMYLDSDARSLDMVLGAWTFGSFAALLLGGLRIKYMNLSGWHKNIDWEWVVKGLKIAFSLLVATLAIRGVFTIDRYWVEYLLGLDVLGAYVLFMGICSALMSFLDAGVFSFLYPGMVSSFQKQDSASFRQGFSKLLSQTLIFSLLFVVAALILIEPLLVWLDKPLYSAQMVQFPWLLFATVLYAVGMVPHFALYAQGLDRPIIQSHILSLFVFAFACWIFSHVWAQIAVPLGLCASFLFILCWKSWSYFELTAVQYRIFQS
ncbi:lipopolysaccharide biosynthesis protein [Pseudomonas putida]|uniref:Polysaccharide biosynthesis protein n=1 Tax=Pseudomonas putida TaxID=303 RepID=A0A1X1A209_PSEPU|nr:oligosaccharide flippase family protein [Pseudomonas putida]ORL66209.1 hypothetical protein B7H17_05500 [Pseudomonas putida]